MVATENTENFYLHALNSRSSIGENLVGHLGKWCLMQELYFKNQRDMVKMYVIEVSFVPADDQLGIVMY